MKTLKIKLSYFLFCCLFLSSFHGCGQITTSLFFDSAGVGMFTKDAIYFGSNNGWIKTDYNLNIIWQKHIPNLYGGNIFGNALYGVTGPDIDSQYVVFKVDTTGNEIWRRSFAAPPHPLAPTTSTRRIHVTPGKNRLYVNTYQFTGNYPYNYYTQITLDSDANFIGAWYVDPYSMSNGAGIGVSSFTSGAWFLYGVSGSFQYISAHKVDSTGQMDQFAGSIFGAVADIRERTTITALPDSNYIFVDCFYYNFYQTQRITCAKFDEGGNIIWARDFLPHYHDINGYSMSHAYSVTGDKDGNTYLYAAFTDSITSSQQGLFTRPAILKLDKNGKIVYLKSWSDQRLQQDSMEIFNLYFHDGNIYASAAFKNINNKGAIMVFDTSFNHPCYAPDTSFAIDTAASSALSGGGGGLNPDTFTYSPAPLMDSVSHTIYDQLISRDLCNTLSVANELIVQTDFFLSPNPTHNQIQFQSSLLRGGANCSIEVFDVIGKLVFEKHSCSVGEKINLSFLLPGLYFLKATSSRNVFTGKFVKE